MNALHPSMKNCTIQARPILLTQRPRLLQKERAEMLRNALAELPLELREVLVLRELQELSYREIASIAQVPMGTVMSRLSRARKRLQQVLLLPENVGEADSQSTPAAR